jgi:hypothetical protein
MVGIKTHTFWNAYADLFLTFNHVEKQSPNINNGSLKFPNKFRNENDSKNYIIDHKGKTFDKIDDGN